MRVNRILLYRAWKYWQLGYSLFLTKPIAIIQFITVMYVLLLERITFLKLLLPHFSFFILVALLILGPSGVLLGWLYMRRTKMYGAEVILSATSNPFSAHANRVSYDMAFQVYQALGVTPSDDWLRMYDLWKRLDEKMGWKP